MAVTTVATDKPALDQTELLVRAQEIGWLILDSREVREYQHWRQVVRADVEAQEAMRRFGKLKILFDECQRFGHFHPEYHKALEAAKQAELELAQIESIRCFKEAEAKLDELLFEVSETIAYAVSDSVKVPGNNPLPTAGKGCGSGGSCGCGG